MNNSKKYKKAYKALSAATKLAIVNRDIDALLAISDRWSILAERSEDMVTEDMPIGFGVQSKNDREKARHKRKG